MRSKVSKLITTVLLVLCMAISMFATSVFATDSESATKIDDCENVMQEYSAEQASKYLAGENTYPKKEGYLFAGWYTTNQLPTDDKEAVEYAIEEIVPEDVETVYALFVPDDVLTIKAQVSKHLLDEDATNDSTAAIRFVTTVDSLLYKKVGFEVSYVDADGNLKSATSASNKVYKQLYEADSTDVWEVTPAGTFCGVSEYFKACTVKNVPENCYETKFTVKPFWETMSGDKVYGETATKSIADGCTRKEVWVSPTGKDAYYYGSYEYPYATLDYALERVKDSGTVHLKDDLTIAAGTEWDPHYKNVTITGDDKDEAVEKLIYTASEGFDIYINDGVTFTDLEWTLPTGFTIRIFAQGNKLVIKDDVTFTNESATVQLLGGSQSAAVESTHLEVYAGTYSAIFGGSDAQNVLGDTKVIVGGKVNSGITATEHSKAHILFGAGWKGTIYGNTNVEVQSGAKFNYVFGGGDNAASVVKGSTNISFAGEAMAIYGGSASGVSGDTHVKMTGGYVEQIFGGSESKSVTGNTDVQILGGEVARRIYGGCYNDQDASWTTGYHVTGYTSVLIDKSATISQSYGSDDSLVAISRNNEAFSDERGVFIFNDYTNNANKDKTGIDTLASWAGINSQTHNYFVRATSGGTVTSAGECLYIVPENGNAATVTLTSADGEVVHYASGNSYYPLPTVSTTGTLDIYVTFNTTEATDFIASAEARIATGAGYAYYETLEQAIVAAEKMDNATIENLSTTKKLATISIADTENGIVTSSCKNCVAGETVTLTVTPDEGYNLTGLTVKKGDTAVDVGTVTLAGGTYSIVTEEGNYTVEATFARKIFKDNAIWGLENQHNGSVLIQKDVRNNETDGDTGWVYGYENIYGDTDFKFTIRDYNSSSKLFRFAVRLGFTNGEYVTFTITNNTGDGAYILQNMGGSILHWTKPGYTLTAEQTTNITSETGLEFRIVRVGDTANIYLDGVHAWQADLSVNTSGNPSGVANLKSDVQLRQYGNVGYEVEVPFSISDAPEMGTITINDSENGTVTASTTKYCIGDEVTLTVTPDNKYDCTSLKIDGKEVPLTNITSGTYTFTATDISYEVDAVFTHKIFKDNTKWDLYGQYEGVLKVTSMDGNGSGWIETYGNTYRDVTVKLRDQDSSSNNFRFAIQFSFTGDNAEVFRISLDNTEANVGYRIQTMGSNTMTDVWKSPYTLDGAEKAKIQSEEGIEFRVAIVGTTAYIFLDGTRACTFDLSKDNDGNDSGIATETAVVFMQLYGNSNHVGTEIEYTLGAEPQKVTVNVAETENGTISKDQTDYIVGENVTLTVAGANCDDTDYENDYYYNSLKVNNEEVTVDSDGNYTFIATETTYDVTGSFAPSIFKSNQAASWDIMNQHKGVVYQKADVTGTSPNLEFVGTYVNSDTSIIIKAGEDDFNEDGILKDTNGDRTAITYWADGIKAVGFSILLEKDGKYYLGHAGGYNGYNHGIYEFNEEETKMIKEGEGIELRTIRIGSEVKIYLEDKYITTYKLPHAADQATTTYIKRFDDAGVRVPIEYKFSETIPETITLDIAENENGTISTDCMNYLVGEPVTLTVTPNEGYDCTSLVVNGEDVKLDDNGTYTFIAEEENTVDATIKRKVTLNINIPTDATYGTITAKKDYFVGDTVELVVAPAAGYNCKDFVVKQGDNVVLTEKVIFAEGTYSFTAEKDNYTIEGNFVEKIFADHGEWDLTTQYDGVISVPSCDGQVSRLDTYSYNYKDLNLTVRDYEKTEKTFKLEVRFKFANNEELKLRLENCENTDNVYRVQLMSCSLLPSTLSWKSAHTFTDVETEAIKSEKGIDFRVAIVGTYAKVYLDGTEVYSVDVSTNNSGNASNVATEKAQISLWLYGSNGKTVEMPFALGGEPQTVTVNIAETTNGTITSDKTEYIVGENVVLTVAGANCDDTDYTNDYYYNSLNVNGKEVMVDSNGNYTFKAAETNTVAGNFAPSIFKSNQAASWDIMNQHKGVIYQKDTVTGNAPNLDLVGSRVNSDTSIIIKAGEDDFNEDGTLKDTNGDRTAICYWSSTATVGFGINLHKDGKYYIGNSAGYNGYDQGIHTFTEEETKLIKEEGIELRVIRNGSNAHIYLDGKFITTYALPYAADEATTTFIKRWDDGGVRAPIEYKFSETLPETVTVNIAETENGTVTTDKESYIVGEKVTLTVKANDGYAYNSLKIDGGENLIVDWNGNYTFTATKALHEVTASFAPSLFKTSVSGWNLTKQYDGIVMATSQNSNGNTDWLDFADTYTDIDVTMTAREYPDTDKPDLTRTGLRFMFNNNADIITFSIAKNKEGDGHKYSIQTLSGDTIVAKDHDFYVLSQEEINKFNSEEGIEFRVVRKGTAVNVYLDGKLVVDSFDLTVDSNGEATGIKADTGMAVTIRRFDDPFNTELPLVISSEVPE